MFSWKCLAEIKLEKKSDMHAFICSKIPAIKATWPVLLIEYIGLLKT